MTADMLPLLLLVGALTALWYYTKDLDLRRTK